MISYATLEPVLVGLIVAASCGFALRRFAPRLLRQLGEFARTAGLPGWLADLLGNPMSADTDCSSGCGSCSNCGPAPKPAKQIVVLHHNKPKTQAEDHVST